MIKMRAPLGATSATHDGVVYEVKDGTVDVHDHVVPVLESHGFSRLDAAPPPTGVVPVMRQHIHDMLEQLGEAIEPHTVVEDANLLDRLRGAVAAAKEKLATLEKPSETDTGAGTSPTEPPRKAPPGRVKSKSAED